MSTRVFALLVGINDYPAGVPKLSGCLNDVEHFRGYLQRAVGKQLAIEVLKDAEATRDNVIRLFRSHLGRAGAGDVAVFHYCGHGAQSASAPAFREFFPNGLDEGLVCIDSRTPGGWDLADKELAVLIGELARNDAHVAFVLDACHTGSATRSVDAFAGLRSRLTHGVGAARPLESYLGGHYARLLAKGDGLGIPSARHILLAACERTQEAKESPIDQRGVFTSTLLEVLEKSAGTLSYADLFVRCRAAVRKRAADQDPQFEPAGHFDAWSGFLGSAGALAGPRYSVYFDAGAWKIDAGAIHGLPDEPEQPVGVVLYDEDDPTRTAGTAQTVEVGAQQSFLALDFKSASDARYRAAITSLPVAPLLVHVAADGGVRDELRAALQRDGALCAALTDEAGAARYQLQVQARALALVQRETGLLIQAAELDAGQAARAADALRPAIKQVAQWERLLGLRNRSSQIDASLIDFACSEPAEAGGEFVHAGEDVTLESVKRDGEWSEIKAKLRLRNRSGRTLHMLLAYFSPAYGVQVLSNDPVESGDAWVTLYGDDPSHAFRLVEGHETEETIDRFKLIASTERVDGFLLEQEDLELGSTVPATRAIGSVKAKKKARSQDWVTKSLRVRVSPRLDEVGDKPWASGDGAIVVKRHHKLKAHVSLGAARPATRAAGEGAPFLDAFERAGLSIASFGHTRGADHSMLELSGIENAQALADEPLEIELNVPLGPDEGLLPFVYDGRHVLLGGDVSKDAEGRTHVSIDHLPDAPSERRSLGGSLKLYFFKTYLKRTSLNKLRWIEFPPDGGFAYRDDGLAGKVASARRVLLLVHGIIGDTEGMAAGVRACGLDRGFDLVLAYDYENLSTPIEENARALKAQLAEAGLRDGDDKHLTLLVHSMGGLVSRWFIEREGGAALVDHLVMCGTPNNGSPFGKIDDARKIITLLTGLAANYVPALIPFSAPILFLLNRSQKVTPTLMQMDPASDFIRTLNASPDPGIPYTILAGDVAAYREPTDALFATLVAKLGRSVVFDALFGMKSNDIAVSIDSILRVGGARARAPKTTQVACHHLNYFVSSAGQEALKAVAW